MEKILVEESGEKYCVGCTLLAPATTNVAGYNAKHCKNLLLIGFCKYKIPGFGPVFRDGKIFAGFFCVA
jgi:hypothetical protein